MVISKIPRPLLGSRYFERICAHARAVIGVGVPGVASGDFDNQAGFLLEYSSRRAHFNKHANHQLYSVF